MKRRDFTRGLVSLGLMPTVPLPAMGAGSTATATAVANADSLYFVGWYTAKLNKTCSAEILASQLKIDSRIANEIFGKLVKNGTVSAPNAVGLSQTLDPLKDTARRIRSQSIKTALDKTSDKFSRVKEFLDTETHDHDPDQTPETQPEIQTDTTETEV